MKINLKNITDLNIEALIDKFSQKQKNNAACINTVFENLQARIGNGFSRSDGFNVTREDSEIHGTNANTNSIFNGLNLNATIVVNKSDGFKIIGEDGQIHDASQKH